MAWMQRSCVITGQFITSSSMWRVMISGHLSVKQWGPIFVQSSQGVKRSFGQRRFPEVHRGLIPTDPHCSLGNKRQASFGIELSINGMDWRVKVVWWSRSTVRAKWETLGLLLPAPTTSIPFKSTMLCIQLVHLWSNWGCIQWRNLVTWFLIHTWKQNAFAKMYHTQIRPFVDPREAQSRATR